MYQSCMTSYTTTLGFLLVTHTESLGFSGIKYSFDAEFTHHKEEAKGFWPPRFPRGPGAFEGKMGRSGAEES